VVPDPAGAFIRIRGAREHNLQGIDVDVPRDRLVVVTGPSGSGKSTLAFDTLYAEGQRRYVESLAVHARQFLEQMRKPAVDAIDGLSPAVAIEQRAVGRSPRSTVGTITEIYDHLRLLFARVGAPHCPTCDRPITRQTVQQMCDRVLALAEGTRVQVLAPVVRGRKGTHERELANLGKQGFVRARIDGEVRDLGDPIALAKGQRHDIDVVVDRIAVSGAARGRISESLEAAVRQSDGLVRIDVGPGEAEWLLSERNACVDCDVAYPDITPRTFSFNGPQGACPGCDGLGTTAEFDAGRVVPNPDRSLAAGAIAPWGGRRRSAYYTRLLEALAEHLAIDLDAPWKNLPADAREFLLHGAATDEVAFELPGPGGGVALRRRWDGVLGELARRHEAAGEGERDELARYRSASPCSACGGTRLADLARSVRLGGASIAQVAALPVAEAQGFFAELEFAAGEREIAERILREIRERLAFLADVGLAYLSLDRGSASLSGGEGQRIRLATQIGANLVGVLYVLDEPSIGLHPRDHARLLRGILRLRDRGNTVVAVEHDADTIRAADWVIDMGPGAGIHGGRVVAAGTPDAIMADPDSLTGAYLSGRRAIPVPRERRPAGGAALVLSGCSEHNLKDVELRLPLGRLTVVTGVSGSGKSTLINDTLQRALAQRVKLAREQSRTQLGRAAWGDRV